MKRRFEVISAYQKQNITCPIRATKSSAGYDFAAAENVTINPQEIILVPTGIRAYFPPSEVLLIFARSSLPIKKHLMLINGVGVIDSDYYDTQNEGHIMFPLYNFSNVPVTIMKGERLAQGIFLKYAKVKKEGLVSTLRTGGFGSSQ